MKRMVTALALVILLGSVWGGIGCSTQELIAPEATINDYPALPHSLGIKASKVAMNQLPFDRGDSKVLAMTDAGYSIIAGHTTERCIDGVIEESGCTIGKGNLLLIHRGRNRPLWFTFFSQDTGECVYLEVNSAVLDKTIAEFEALSDREVFTKIEKENIGAAKLLAEPDAWQEKMTARVFGGGWGAFTNEFTIITIANVWAKGNGSPRELLSAAQFHNHICPGLTSGYFILEYLDKYLPLEKPSQGYQIIAIPPWCKDDVLQWNLEATIGNKNYVAKELSWEQSQGLPKEAKHVAGIYIRWDAATGTGDGLVLAFDWDKASEISGFDYQDFWDFRTYKWWWTRLKMDLDMMDYLDKPETVVTTIREFSVKSPGELSKLKSAGVNPLAELGIMPKPEVSVRGS